MDVDLEELDELQKSGLSRWRMDRVSFVVFAWIRCWCADSMLHIARSACARTTLQFCVLTMCLCECVRLEVCLQDQRRRRISLPKLTISSPQRRPCQPSVIHLELGSSCCCLISNDGTTTKECIPCQHKHC